MGFHSINPCYQYLSVEQSCNFKIIGCIGWLLICHDKTLQISYIGLTQCKSYIHSSPKCFIYLTGITSQLTTIKNVLL